MQPKKILIVEDYPLVRYAWITGLKEDGVDVGTKEIFAMSNAPDAPFVFSYGEHAQIHLAGTHDAATQLLKDNVYDLCFMDRDLDTATSDNLIVQLLRDTQTQVVSISGTPKRHCDDVATVFKTLYDGVPFEGRFIPGSKDYTENRSFLAKFLGVDAAPLPPAPTPSSAADRCGL